MNQDIKKYPVYMLQDGRLTTCDICSVNDYNHYRYNLHHYIKQQDYKRNEQWYKERGIEQKLILLPISTHEQVHQQAIKNLTDEEFEDKYGISRWELVFNRKYSDYETVEKDN